MPSVAVPDGELKRVRPSCPVAPMLVPEQLSTHPHFPKYPHFNSPSEKQPLRYLDFLLPPKLLNTVNAYCRTRLDVPPFGILQGSRWSQF